ncbi:MAG TPA: hypothetical protein VEJ21_01070, partial [Acidimicrobiales bacterium]|nr:hypothetical protein [Acidimicrobiales bacterium]
GGGGAAGRAGRHSGGSGLVRYIDAGYVAALSVLFVYGVGLLYRRRRLERSVGTPPDGAEPGPRLDGP